MKNPRVDIHLIVQNGEKYIRKCLEHVKVQGYSNTKVRIFDNNSSDNSIKIANEVIPDAEVINFDRNYSLGGGFNRSLYFSDAPYVVLLSVDIFMHGNFTENAVNVMEGKDTVGALQAKIFKYDWDKGGFSQKQNPEPVKDPGRTSVIDTTGMQIFKSGRVINRGHGEEDKGQYNTAGAVFCYEGAVPIFRRRALEEVKMQKFPPFYAPYTDKKDASKYPYEYLDEDFVWYADEVDLGWRIRLYGWESYYSPDVIAWHDRQTTKKLSGGRINFIKQRKTIPIRKRRLDFRNLRLTFVKNGFWSNTLLTLPYTLKREIMLFVYILFWERGTLRAYAGILKMMPKILKKRGVIMNSKKISAKEIRYWFK